MNAVRNAALCIALFFLAFHLLETLKMAASEFRALIAMRTVSAARSKHHQDFIQLVQLMLNEAVTRVAVEDACFDKSLVKVRNRNAPHLFSDRGCGLKEISLTFSDALTSDESLDMSYVYDTDFSPPVVLSATARFMSAGKVIPLTQSAGSPRGGWYTFEKDQVGPNWLYLQLYEYLIWVDEATRKELEKREKLKQIKEGNRLTQAEVGSLLKSVGIQMRPEGDQ